jgi:NADH dehydrogenase FAD-containing subunit
VERAASDIAICIINIRVEDAFCPHTNLIMREVEGIDLKKQIVTISPGFRPRQLQLRYEHLVIALGNVTDFHGMPGMMESEVTLTREATMNSAGFTCMVKYEASVWANFRLDAPHVV